MALPTGAALRRAIKEQDRRDRACFKEDYGLTGQALDIAMSLLKRNYTRADAAEAAKKEVARG